MVLCIGEILADMIGGYRGDVFCYERNAGGAPFNVACGVKRFGGSAAFIGNVGDDAVGKYLLEFARGRSLDGCLVNVDKIHNTTLAFVDLDKSGERSFCFYRKDTADFHLPQPPEELLQKADIVYVGSLMISENKGFKYAKSVIKKAKALKKLVAFDVNYRTDIFRDAAEAAKRYKAVMEQADILKLSEDEVEIFTEEYISSLTDKLVCISLGEAGSMWRYKGQSRTVKSIRVKPQDTTGAGDAFYAGVLTKLSAKPQENWTADRLDEALRFGNVCGALNTLGKGAISRLPSLEEIEKYL